LKEAIAKAGYEDCPDLFLLRFLENTSYSPEKAFEKLTVCLKWYTENKIGDLLMEAEPKENEIMKKLIPHSVTNGVDNEGRPLYIELTGKIKANMLAANISKEQFLQCHAWGMQQMIMRGEVSSKELKKPVTKFAMIMDLEGLGPGHRVGLPFILSVIAFDDKYYPNFLGKVYVVNGGWLFPMMFQILKPTLPQFILDQVELVSGNPAEGLLNFFPKETLPPMYGGSGPEVPILDTSDLKSASATTWDGEELEEVNIGAGDKLEICIEAENGAGTFGWYFISDGDYDVGFSVAVEEKEQKEGEQIIARKYEKLITDQVRTRVNMWNMHMLGSYGIPFVNMFYFFCLGLVHIERPLHSHAHLGQQLFSLHVKND